jgi:hypothetical protein
VLDQVLAALVGAVVQPAEAVERLVGPLANDRATVLAPALWTSTARARSTSGAMRTVNVRPVVPSVPTTSSTASPSTRTSSTSVEVSCSPAVAPVIRLPTYGPAGNCGRTPPPSSATSGA